MKKFPRKFQYPLMASMVLPTMLLGMTAIMSYRMLPVGGDFMATWGAVIGQIIPYALLLFVVVVPTVRLFVTKFLLEPEEH